MLANFQGETRPKLRLSDPSRTTDDRFLGSLSGKPNSTPVKSHSRQGPLNLFFVSQ